LPFSSWTRPAGTSRRFPPFRDALDLLVAHEQRDLDDLGEGAFPEVTLGSSSFTIVNRWWPPTRASMSTLTRGTDKLTGPNHRASWAEPVNAG
jgi:hypothetical protein